MANPSYPQVIHRISTAVSTKTQLSTFGKSVIHKGYPHSLARVMRRVFFWVRERMGRPKNQLGHNGGRAVIELHDKVL